MNFRLIALTVFLGAVEPLVCAAEQMTELDAYAAVPLMSPGINIGNTLENTASWETGWGNPPITRGFVESLARLGFRTVRLPVAWDTYAVQGHIQTDKLRRVRQVVDWITAAGMFCVIDIHWDGGWIDSDWKPRFPRTFATFSAEAQRKYRAYWEQIARFFADENEKVIFEALNEETNFSNEGSPADAYATLTRVNQMFIDTVRGTGGRNAKRLLVVVGYSTDIQKTSDGEYRLPRDTIPGRLFISVHYYTPYEFCGLDTDTTWGKVRPTWGNADDMQKLEQLFDMLNEFTRRNDIPAFIGEFGVSRKRESISRIRWMSAVANAARSRGMVPVLWDTGGDVSRRLPYAPSPELVKMLQGLGLTGGK